MSSILSLWGVVAVKLKQQGLAIDISVGNLAGFEGVDISVEVSGYNQLHI